MDRTLLVLGDACLVFDEGDFLLVAFCGLVWDFTDLLGIPLIQGLKAQMQQVASVPAKLFAKEDPAAIPAQIEQEERKRIREWAQAHCRHIHKRNGLWNYFCPLCGKKLIEIGDPPLWQI